jgi:hypothetical protein
MTLFFCDFRLHSFSADESHKSADEIGLRPRYAQNRTEGKPMEVFAEAHLFSTYEDNPLSS